jgi:Xaa-Pro dipeptidase
MSNLVDRRRLLGGLALIAAVPACAATAAPAAGAGAAPPGGAKPGAGAASAYPPLAPLDEATFERRADRLRGLAREAGASVVFVSSGTTSFAYLAGSKVDRSERLIAWILPVDGAAFLVAPAFEAERMRRQTKLRDVRPWEESESPYAIARDALGAAGSRARILVEPHTEYQAAVALAKALPGATLIDGAAVFERLRLHKDADELARIRRAVAVTQDVFEAAFAALRPGVRDREVSRAIADRFRAAGYEGYALVQFGPLSALPHGHPRGDALAEGLSVLIDGGCEVDGYWSDITRTRVFGAAPSPEFVKVHQIVHDAQSAAIERVKPGVAAQEIDRAARAVINKAGYGPQFTHRLGHGLGMDGHEPAYMVEGNAQRLEPGFVFTVEPGIYLPDKFGVRIEDDVLCGPDGAVVLSRRAAGCAIGPRRGVADPGTSDRALSGQVVRARGANPRILNAMRRWAIGRNRLSRSRGSGGKGRRRTDDSRGGLRTGGRQQPTELQEGGELGCSVRGDPGRFGDARHAVGGSDVRARSRGGAGRRDPARHVPHPRLGGRPGGAGRAADRGVRQPRAR